MSLTIDLINLLAATNELSNIKTGLIEGLLGVQCCHSDRMFPQPSMRLKNSSDPADEYLKENDQAIQEQDAACISNPGNLAGISTFDFTELRNYIYGVNGRY
jgi:hypothetical protein